MDNSFTFQCPTKIYFRPNGLDEIGSIIKKDYNFSKVYLIYGGKSLKASGSYDRIIKSLKDNNLIYKEYSGIQANPDIEDVRKIVEEIKVFKPDLLLACGGGSVLDATKSAAHGYYYDGDPLDFNKKLVEPLHALPVATILTLAASGSEMSDSCVISDRKHHFKSGFNCVSNYPLFSLMDYDLLKSVPPYQIGVGLADMFCHSLERFFSASHKYEPCDNMALGVLKSIVEVSKPIIDNPSDEDARRGMMICGSVAHNGFTNYGKTKVFIIHRAEHMLSARYPELLHGQGIALLMVRFLEINENKLSNKIKRLGISVFSLPYDCDTSDVIKEFKKWIDILPIYHSFDALPFKITKEELDKADEMLKI